MQFNEGRSAPVSRTPKAWQLPDTYGLDGTGVSQLLQGAGAKGLDPADLLRQARINPAVCGDANATINGQDLVRLVRQIQFSLDDVYLGFLPQRCRLALETERIMCLMHAATLGEAVRVSVRFTNAMAPDAGPVLSEEGPGVLRHTCNYRTIEGTDRSILVWIRFVWIYQFFSWLIGRPLTLRGLTIRGPRPVQQNGFDRFSVFRCPVRFDAPADSLLYDVSDLNMRLTHRSNVEYDSYYSNEPDWFDTRSHERTWSERTAQEIQEFQKSSEPAPSIEAVARRLKTSARRLRVELAAEGESFRDIRTRLKGELAGAYLIASDLAVQQIGEMLGFSEPGSFTRHFVAWAGTSPTVYRARHSDDAAEVAAATALLNARRIPEKPAGRPCQFRQTAGSKVSWPLPALHGEKR